MNIKPLGDRIVIKVLENEEKQKVALFYLILPRKTSKGEVLQ